MYIFLDFSKYKSVYITYRYLYVCFFENSPCFVRFPWHLPSLNLWKRRFLLETTIFRCHVSFREGIHLSHRNWGPPASIAAIATHLKDLLKGTQLEMQRLLQVVEENSRFFLEGKLGPNYGWHQPNPPFWWDSTQPPPPEIWFFNKAFFWGNQWFS